MANMTLQKRISQLPNELKILIGEFNVEHRPELRKCHDEFFNIIYTDCLVCSKQFPCSLFYSVDYFIYHRFKISCYWCSSECFENHHDHILKTRYLKSIQEYLAHHSFQCRNVEPELGMNYLSGE